ncbi:hypothetical protein DFH94DRAFT_744177 [Russula ochroleuca]|jgi:hypothetical protein|uniref:Uncharacterized protein n=1 Tax=Russula ochroleuca TaxID=152965 RepID=A0A9P5MV26_9AGAM|nr:hypothetical protein DFH94DRAFT_744177 [Russula ochroleuca]
MENFSREGVKPCPIVSSRAQHTPLFDTPRCRHPHSRPRSKRSMSRLSTSYPHVYSCVDSGDTCVDFITGLPRRVQLTLRFRKCRPPHGSRVAFVWRLRGGRSGSRLRSVWRSRRGHLASCLASTVSGSGASTSTASLFPLIIDRIILYFYLMIVLLYY